MHKPDGHHGHHDPHHHRFVNADEWAQRFDEPSRDAWQRPEEVLRALELEPTMTVADVGAGTGYFAVRLARAVPAGVVLAIDVEPDMLRYLGERAEREHLTNLRTSLATPTESGLAPGSVDRVLVVHVWHHLADRTAHARALAAALRPGGRLCVVDFSPTGERGPPIDMRFSPGQIVAELAAAGLAAKLSPTELPDQYLVEARREP